MSQEFDSIFDSFQKIWVGSAEIFGNLQKNSLKFRKFFIKSKKININFQINFPFQENDENLNKIFFFVGNKISTRWHYFKWFENSIKFPF